jgi:hypothetical protein
MLSRHLRLCPFLSLSTVLLLRVSLLLLLSVPAPIPLGSVPSRPVIWTVTVNVVV